MTTTFAKQITVDRLDADPYSIYARLRREAPVCWVPAVKYLVCYPLGGCCWLSQHAWQAIAWKSVLKIWRPKV